MLAVSIASDIVPLVDENRILAFYGLKKLNENPSMGLKAIIATAGLDGKNIAVDDIVFKIGPRINAAGRIESGKQAVELLIADTPESAFTHCEKINLHNQTRRNIDKLMTEEALQEITSRSDKYKYSTVLFNPAWHKGVVGIVASRLIESYYRPTIILTESNGLRQVLRVPFPDSIYTRPLPNALIFSKVMVAICMLRDLTLKIEHVQKLTDRFEEIVKEHNYPGYDDPPD